MKRSTLAQIIAAALLPGLAWAQSAQAQNQTPSTPTTSQSATRNAAADASAAGAKARALRDVRASKLIGMQVRNPQGENLGEIQDVIVDVRNSRVQYAVLSTGGFLGLGDKWFAYPVAAFSTTADRDELILNVDKDRLKDAPGFTRNQWPTLSRYAGEVDRFFARLGIGDADGDRVLRNDGDRIGRNDGSPRPDSVLRNDSNPRGDQPLRNDGDRLLRNDGSPRPDSIARNDSNPGSRTNERDPAVRNDLARNPDLRRASELIGRDLRDRAGRDAGEIEDLVINMGSGRVRYAVVDFDKAWSPDDKMLALPLSAFRFGQGRTEAARLNVPRERLDMSRGFDENQWPDLNDERYRADIDRYLATVVAPAGERGRSGGAASR